MHMKEDHMRNTQLKPGYNVQIGVEGEYIVGLDISSERSNQLTLIPFLENLKLKLHKTYKNVVADAGYESEDCNGCEYKDKCTKSKGNRQIHIPKKFIDLRENSLTNIKSAGGILLRMNRSIQVEGTFGVLKENYGFRQFLTRGKENVKCEFLLLSFAFNINKLHTKMRKNKLGVSFFMKDIA